MQKHFVISMFEVEDGAIHVGCSMLDDGPRVTLRTYVMCETAEDAYQELSKAVDALTAYWRHGALYAEPLASGWR